MPVVLPASSYEEWLDPANADAVRLNRLVQTRAVSEFMAYPVTTYVNNPRNQGEQCLAPKTGTDPP